MIDYSEFALIEQPAIELYANLGWDTCNCCCETFGPNGTLGREARHEVVFLSGKWGSTPHKGGEAS